MNVKNPYEIFTKYILRTPIFSFSDYKRLTRDETINDDELKSICKSKLFQESIFLSSPDLLYEINKWVNNELSDKDRKEKIKITVLKYFTRMCTRCTPYGTFAGCSVGNLNEETDVVLQNKANFSKHTRLDMRYLISLVEGIFLKDPEITKNILFYPNSSIYETSNEIRYVEYKNTGKQREHQIVSVENNDFLQRIIKFSHKGVYKHELVDELSSDEEITVEDAINFINALVDSQFIVSELEATVSGEDYFDFLLKKLNSIKPESKVSKTLDELNKQIKEANKTIGNSIDHYNDIISLIKGLNVAYNPKHLFVVDLVPCTKTNNIALKHTRELKNSLSFFAKASLPIIKGQFIDFKNKFYERYEEEQVELSTALDPEKGIGYNLNKNSGDINPLLDGLDIIPMQDNLNQREMIWSSFHTLLNNKLTDAYRKGKSKIILTDNDLKEFDTDWSDLPDTISLISKIINEDGKEKIFISGGKSTSAASLLARFCFSNQEVRSHVIDIISTEEKLNQNKIIAEIVHLPDPRIGNISYRPDFRKYEIPYLARSPKKNEFKIDIKDLFISVQNRNKKLKIYSKKHNKEIVPRLTNAHNFSKNPLPIYKFLCDAQTNDIRDNFSFQYSPNSNEFEYLPRIEYNNIIFQEATWNLRKEQLDSFFKLDDSDLIVQFNIFRKELKIPQLSLLAEGDNHLLINFKNLNSIKMLLNIIRKKRYFKLKEFLFSEEGVVKDIATNDYYTNEIIFSFYKNVK